MKNKISLDTAATSNTELENNILGDIKISKKYSLIDLSNKFDVSPAKIELAVKSLVEKGHNLEYTIDNKLEISKDIPKQSPLVIDTKDYFGNDWIRFGVVADTHLVSKYARLDVLNALYDVFHKEGIQTVLHGGNWIDGEARFNKYDILCSGIENQVKYFIDNYPKREGMKTKIISGDDHEGWYVQREGINIGKIMQDRARQAGRNDLIDLGYMERDLIFKKGKGQSSIRVMHAGGGSTYAISYTSQKYVESLQGGDKPTLAVVGHFHKFDWAYPREVNVLQPGATQDQTPFMRKKRIQSMVGGCILEIKQDSQGNFIRNKVEWIPFYDKKHYEYKM